MSPVAPVTFFVEHHVQDKQAWEKAFSEMIANVKDKTTRDAANDEFWGGNACLLTFSSVHGDKAFCIWQLPAGSSVEDFKAFINKVTGGEPIVMNVPFKVEGSMGMQNLSFDKYLEDMQKLANEGSVKGFSDDGELYFVHHNIPDKEAWDKVFGEKMELLKGKSSTQDVTESWQVGDGVKGVMWCGLGDKDGMCMWSVPKGWTESDFQKMNDKFSCGAAKNDVFKVEPSSCLGSRVLHPDFYTQEAVAFANSA